MNRDLQCKYRYFVLTASVFIHIEITISLSINNIHLKKNVRVERINYKVHEAAAKRYRSTSRRDRMEIGRVKTFRIAYDVGRVCHASADEKIESAKQQSHVVHVASTIYQSH